MVDILRDAIATGRYQAGSRLIERELTERYGVSRTVIRETLRHLEAEGFVHIQPGAGPVVSGMSVEEATAVYEVRGALEGLAAKQFTMRASNSTKEELTSVVERIEAYTDDDTEALLLLKDEFYEILLRGAGNSVVVRMLQTLHSRVRFLRSLSLGAKGRSSQSALELRAIVEAVQCGDADAAAKACEVHVKNAASSALGRLQSGESKASE